MKVLLLKIFILLIIITGLTFCSARNTVPDYYSESYIKSPPNNDEAYQIEQKARDLSRENNHKQAVELYTSIINNHPNYNHLYRIYTGRGITYHKMKKTAKALSDYLRAIELYPYFINAYISLGLLYKHIGDNEKAKHVFNECIRIMPEKKKEFEALIASLKPFVIAQRQGNDLIYIYDYNSMNFLFKSLNGYNIETGENPYHPIILYKQENKAQIHFFIMDFNDLPQFRFLSFKDRTQRWANMEQSIFNSLFNRNVELNEIKEETIYSIRTGYIEIDQPEIKYRMTFFYTGKFGIMIMLKGDKNNYLSGVNDVKSLLKDFKSNF